MEKNGKIALGIIAVVVVAGGGAAWFLLIAPNLAPTGPGNETVTITISGSTTCLPIVSACAEDFMAIYTTWDIQVSGGGSSQGVSDAKNAVSMIGMASRNVKSSENTTGWAIQTPMAKDGIAVIYDADATHGVIQLTDDQLFLIYNGTYTNWNQVGGAAAAIVPMGRDSASGTRASFEELLKVNGTELGDDAGYQSATIQEYASNGALATAVAANPGAIGYCGLGYVDDTTVKGIAIDAGSGYIAPSVATVQAGTYPISRSLWFITIGEPTGNTLTFINYVLGPAGQKVAEEEGFVRLY